jgi:hypothetical protein
MSKDSNCPHSVFPDSENLDFSNKIFNSSHLSNHISKSCWPKISFNNVILTNAFKQIIMFGLLKIIYSNSKYNGSCSDYIISPLIFLNVIKNVIRFAFCVLPILPTRIDHAIQN